MKKSSFVAMVLGTVSVVLFALGMCMALIPESAAGPCHAGRMEKDGA